MAQSTTNISDLPNEILTLIFSYFLNSDKKSYDTDMWEQITKYIMPLLHTCSRFRSVIREENHELWKYCFVDLRWSYLSSPLLHQNVESILDEKLLGSLYDEMMELLNVVMGGSQVIKKVTLIEFPTSYLENGQEKSWLSRILNDFKNVEQIVWMDSYFNNEELSTACMKFPNLKTLSIYSDNLAKHTSLIKDNENITDLNLSLGGSETTELMILKDNTFRDYELTNVKHYKFIREYPEIFKFISFLNSNEMVPIELFSHLSSLDLKYDSISLNNTFRSEVLLGLELNCKKLEMIDLNLPNLKKLSLRGVESLTYRNNTLNIEDIRIEEMDTNVIECIPVQKVESICFARVTSAKIERNKWQSLENIYLNNVKEVYICIDRLKTLIISGKVNGQIDIEHVDELTPPSSPCSITFNIDSVDKVSLEESGVVFLKHIHSIKGINLSSGNISKDVWTCFNNIKVTEYVHIKKFRPRVEMRVDCTKYDIKAIPYEECFHNNMLRMNRFMTVSSEILETDSEIETLADLSISSTSPFVYSRALTAVPILNKLTNLTLEKTFINVDLSLLPQLTHFNLSNGEETSNISLLKEHPSLRFIYISEACVSLRFIIDCPNLREFILSELDLDIFEDTHIEIVNTPKLLTFHIDNMKEYLEKGQLVIKNSIRF